jgi:hypothetical protein
MIYQIMSPGTCPLLANKNGAASGAFTARLSEYLGSNNDASTRQYNSKHCQLSIPCDNVETLDADLRLRRIPYALGKCITVIGFAPFRSNHYFSGRALTCIGIDDSLPDR